jgi:amino acid transporter
MEKKFLGVGSLALLQVAIVANLQPLSANALYGFTLPFLYFGAVIGFFLPCVLMVAELATNHPQTGGAYIWSEKAFGKNTGFITVVLLWISNLLWYPTIFTLIAMNAVYVFEPSLAANKTFIISLSLFLFWMITGLNCIGVKLSSRFSISFGMIGIILPILIISLGGLVWWLGGHTIALTLTDTPLIPDMKSLSHIGFLIAVATSLFGIEIPAVHAGDVKNPRRDFPRSLVISAVIILILLLSVELSLAIIVPPEKLSLVTGVLDAIKIFLAEIHLNYLIIPLLFLILIGNIGSITAWMLGSTRGMFVACKKNNITKILQITNRKESPVGVLIIEGIIFTIVSSVFLMLPQIIDSFWLLLDVASQISLIYYIILFSSTLRLRYLAGSKPNSKQAFLIPGGKLMLWLWMGLGIFTSLIALLSGFIAPPELSPHDAFTFHVIMCLGLAFAFVFPAMILFFKKSQPLTD